MSWKAVTLLATLALCATTLAVAYLHRPTRYRYEKLPAPHGMADVWKIDTRTDEIRRVIPAPPAEIAP